ncbi:MAG: S1 RNA-binding domain-containing protein [bacterium]
MNKGEIVIGTVTGIKSYGAFVKLENGTGLVHISEFSDGFVTDINQIVSVGEDLTLEVIEYDDKQSRFKLSFKKCNVIPSKAHKFIKVIKGYCPLGVKMETWKKEALEKYKEKL